jgi:hypothetical protein
MLLVGSKESDFNSGNCLQRPLSFLMLNLPAQECDSKQREPTKRNLCFVYEAP